MIARPILVLALAPLMHAAIPSDPRDISTGNVIAGITSGYSDQPMCIKRQADGAWVCLTTYGVHAEGSGGEAVISSISKDRGVTWSPKVPLVPDAKGITEYAYATIFQVPSGRIWGVYVINSDDIKTIPTKLQNGTVVNKTITRTDMLGHFKMQYSDDGGESWSAESYEVPVRKTGIDTRNEWNGAVQMHWVVDHSSVVGEGVYFAFAKIGTYCVNPPTSVWFMHSPNIGRRGIEPTDITWELLPEGDDGVHSWTDPASGSAISEEGHVLPLDGGGFYSVFRTTAGRLGAASSADGRAWQVAPFATYWRDPAFRAQADMPPRFLDNPRGPITPRQVNGDTFIMLYYNVFGTSFADRNPYWIAPGWRVPGTNIIEWGQPEIALYLKNRTKPAPLERLDGPSPINPHHGPGAGYPDFIVEADAVYITETDKVTARVHKISSDLLADLLGQRWAKKVAGHPAAEVEHPKAGSATPLGKPFPNLETNNGTGQGFSLEAWLCPVPISTKGGALLDARAAVAGTGGRAGVALQWTGQSALLSMSDGARNFTATLGHAAAGILRNASSGHASGCHAHHLAVTVDAGPGVLTWLVDGMVVGWVHIPNGIGDLHGANSVTIGAGFSGSVIGARVYAEALTNTRLIGNARAGPDARATQQVPAAALWA